jgi:hypothetical protein
VGTVLSLWDAAALDAAGHDGEVAPTFINLADASIKMVCRLAHLAGLVAKFDSRLRHCLQDPRMGSRYKMC